MIEFESNNVCLKTIGQLMIQSWKEKKGLTEKVSNDLIDDALEVGLTMELWRKNSWSWWRWFFVVYSAKRNS